MKALAERLQTMEKGYAIEENGLRLFRDLNEVEWCELGNDLTGRRNSTCWAIGDWLVIGHGKDEFVNSYKRASKITGLSPSTLSSYFAVSRAYPFSKRVQGASFGWHRAALAVRDDTRVPFLRRAVQEHWNWDRFDTELDKLTEKQRGKLADMPDGMYPKSLAKSSKWRKRNSLVTGIRCPHCGKIIEKARLKSFTKEQAEKQFS
jgi:DNA-directed RNA polymerase subunit RPC12/RpoP